MRPVRKADNLTTTCVVVMKSGNLNFLEPSGPLQACKGTALPLPLLLTQYCSGDKIEMGGECSAYEGEERRTGGFGGET